ncbi:AAEL014342-PA [Aedes aegypti]|uniref:AAEL014342-PA n=1 Tax=Aedes aegypti TaxID=7159 RepID=Q16GL1_AEDAE|nr:AAEL014342-PA [Aedes aegypti]
MKLPLSFKSTKVESHLTELCHRLSTLQPFRLMSNSFQLPSLPSSATTIRFLTRSEIASVKFCRNPSVHRQRHHLAVTLNHREDGIFRLTVADHEVRKLLNLTGGDRGWQALVSTLNRMNRFEYDRFRPASAFQFHQMSISEKILYQFFATSPECGQGPGWVLRFDDVRNYCEGDGVRLEEFNCFRHTYGGGFSKANASDIDLSEGLDPAIVQRMKEIKRNASHMHQI